MNEQMCEVCGKKAEGVASSTLGAISFAYCHQCNVSGAEPYGMLVGTVGTIFEDNWKEEIKKAYGNTIEENITATLIAVGKSREEFDNDVDKFIEESKQELFIEQQLEEMIIKEEGGEENV